MFTGIRAELRKLVAELDQKAGSAIELLSDLSAEDGSTVEDETLLEGLHDLQASLTDWQLSEGLI